MHFGGLVSTSNIIEADEVAVESDAHLVWTTKLRGGGGGGTHSDGEEPRAASGAAP